jgi:hypothetical protein
MYHKVPVIPAAPCRAGGDLPAQNAPDVPYLFPGLYAGIGALVIDKFYGVRAAGPEFSGVNGLGAEYAGDKNQGKGKTGKSR